MKRPSIILPSRKITHDRVMDTLLDLGFFKILQPRNPFLDNGDVDCEIQFFGPVSLIRVISRMHAKPAEIGITVNLKNGERLEMAARDMPSFNALIKKIIDQVKDSTVAYPDRSRGGIDSGIDIVGEDQ
jgi:hypothetical protein